MVLFQNTKQSLLVITEAQLKHQLEGIDVGDLAAASCFGIFYLCEWEVERSSPANDSISNYGPTEEYRHSQDAGYKKVLRSRAGDRYLKD